MTVVAADRREVILVRTHYFDSELAAFVARLEEAGRLVCLCVDETRAPLETPEGIERLSLTRAEIARLGLRETRETAWQCGDYGFYLAQERYPGASHFWVIEPDLLINVADLRGFFDRLGGHPEVDLIACQLRPASPRWFWHGPSLPHFREVWHCIYPLVRVSAGAVGAMRAARERMAASLAQDAILANPSLWPNDEALTAGACADAGLICRDLNAFGAARYDRRTFSFDRPHSLARLARRGADGRIYHPVLSGERFHAKIERQIAYIEGAPSLDSLSRLDRRVMRDLARECGPDVAARLRRRIHALARRIDPLAPRRQARLLLYRLRRWVRARAGRDA